MCLLQYGCYDKQNGDGVVMSAFRITYTLFLSTKLIAGK
jgi:hypothetical protein